MSISFTKRCSTHQNSQIRLRSGANHIVHKTLVSWSVQNSEVLLIRLEKCSTNFHRFTLFSFCFSGRKKKDRSITKGSTRFFKKRTRKRNTKHRERGRIKNPLKDPFSCIQQITIFKELGGMECNWPNRTQRKKFVFLVKMFFSNTESVQSQTITTSKFQ